MNKTPPMAKRGFCTRKWFIEDLPCHELEKCMVLNLADVYVKWRKNIPITQTNQKI